MGLIDIFNRMTLIKNKYTVFLYKYSPKTRCPFSIKGRIKETKYLPGVVIDKLLPTKSYVFFDFEERVTAIFLTKNKTCEVDLNFISAGDKTKPIKCFHKIDNVSVDLEVDLSAECSSPIRNRYQAIRVDMDLFNFTLELVDVRTEALKYLVAWYLKNK